MTEFEEPKAPRQRSVRRRRLLRVLAVLLGLYALWTVAVNIPGKPTDGAVAYSFAFATESLETACSVELDAKRLCTVTRPGDSVEVSAVYELTRDGRCWTAKRRHGSGSQDRWPESPHGCIVLSDNLCPDERVFRIHEAGLRRDDPRFDVR